MMWLTTTNTTRGLPRLAMMMQPAIDDAAPNPTDPANVLNVECFALIMSFVWEPGAFPWNIVQNIFPEEASEQRRFPRDKDSLRHLEPMVDRLGVCTKEVMAFYFKFLSVSPGWHQMMNQALVLAVPPLHFDEECINASFGDIAKKWISCRKLKIQSFVKKSYYRHDPIIKFLQSYDTSETKFARIELGLEGQSAQDINTLVQQVVVEQCPILEKLDLELFYRAEDLRALYLNPTLFSSSHLKEMRLSIENEVTDCGFIMQLFQNLAPSLQILNLNVECGTGLDVFEIKSNSLKTLNVSDFWPSKGSTARFALDCPKLKKFIFEGSCFIHKPTGLMKLVVNQKVVRAADIDIPEECKGEMIPCGFYDEQFCELTEWPFHLLLEDTVVPVPNGFRDWDLMPQPWPQPWPQPLP